MVSHPINACTPTASKILCPRALATLPISRNYVRLCVPLFIYIEHRMLLLKPRPGMSTSVSSAVIITALQPACAA